jgi:hypothetical protein
MKKIEKLISILFAVLSLSLNVSAQNVNERNISFDFCFSSGSTILHAEYGVNRMELANLKDFVLHNKYSIHTGKSHFAIISFISKENQSNLYTLNRASVLASVVRAHLKTRYGFSNQDFTFIMRTENEIADCVRLEYRPFSVRSNENQDIHYTLNPSYRDLAEVISRYEVLPIENNNSENSEKPYNQPVHVTDSLPPLVTLMTHDTLSPVDTVSLANTPPHNQPTVLANTTESPHQITDDCVEIKPYYKPIFGLKINVLNLAGVTPPASVVKPRYNITTEFYYLKRFSVEMGGYINPIFNHKQAESVARHKLSGVSLEQRFWLGKPELFKGFYLGLYGAFGEFDIYDLQKCEEGVTGNYIGGGLSIGFALPVSKRLILEIGVRGGYNRESSSNYLVLENTCYKTGTSNDAGLKLHDYNISLVYRLIGKQKRRGL